MATTAISPRTGKPKRKYTRRNPARSSTDSTRQQPTEEPTGQYSQYLSELGTSLKTRDEEIAKRLGEIEQESDALETEEATLTEEQIRVRNALWALGEKK